MNIVKVRLNEIVKASPPFIVVCDTPFGCLWEHYTLDGEFVEQKTYSGILSKEEVPLQYCVLIVDDIIIKTNYIQIRFGKDYDGNEDEIPTLHIGENDNFDED